MSRIPFVLVGDAPNQTSGLSRILTDLAVRLVAHQDALNLDVRTVGYGPWRDLPMQGLPSPASAEFGGQLFEWPNWIFGDFSSRGRQALTSAWRYWFGTKPGIVFSVWDPARVEGVALADLPIERWGYFAVDAMTPTGRITGPAGEWLSRYQRKLGYTKFGADLLEVTEHLPHGLNQDAFDVPTDDEQQWALQQIQTAVGKPILGCVATNQARKDLSIWAQALRNRPKWYGWLHTDRLVGEAWSVPQLLDDYGLADRVTVTLGGPNVPMRAIYASCSVTIAPGRGEGWGYPIAESLAQGVPAIHLDYAGGREVGREFHAIGYDFHTVEGVYNLTRPLWDVMAVDFRLHALSQDRHNSVARLGNTEHAQQFHWDTIWPAWQAWITEGVANYGRT